MLRALISTTVVAVAGIVLRRMVLRRRTTGVARLAELIPVHSAFWRAQRALPRGDDDIEWVVIGDSAAQGIGASRPDRGYVGLLSKLLEDRTGRRVHVVNLSVSGARLREAIAKQLPALAKLEPDLVTASIGANDIGSPDGFDRARFERELREVYDALPDGAIVAELPSFYFGRGEQHVRWANDLVRRVARERGFGVAHLHRRTVAQTAAKTALRDVSDDFFHPNDRGYRVWASAFEPAIEAWAVRHSSSPA